MNSPNFSKNAGLMHRLRVFENAVLRRTFGPKGEEVAGGWRKLHNEKLHHLYTTPNISRVIKWRRMGWNGMGKICNAHGGMRNTYIYFSRKT
jgi:hypothetical protein